ncbi:MAG: DUF481 domain-containing protein [Armatimonadota bacterium]|nr:DUF481 domain-containing protein [Armatimonadota bacterium]
MFWRGTWIVACVVLAISAVCADEVRLGEQDRITGSILGMEGKRLRVSTPYAGELRLSWDLVTDLQSEAPLAVFAEGGRVIVGLLTGVRNGVLMVQTPDGVARVDMNSVIELSTELPRGEKPKPKVKWKGDAELGIGYVTGNSTRQDLLVGANLRRVGPVLEWNLSARAEQGRSKKSVREADGTVRSENVRDVGSLRGAVNVKWNQPGRLFFALSSITENDEVKDLRLREKAALTLGYKLIQRPPNTWTAELGTSYTNEKYASRKHTEDVGLRLKSGTTWRLMWGSSLRLNVTADPTFSRSKTTDRREVRTNADLSLEFPLASALRLRLSVIDDYQSAPPPNVKRNDVRTRTTLAYQF